MTAKCYAIFSGNRYILAYFLAISVTCIGMDIVCDQLTPFHAERLTNRRHMFLDYDVLEASTMRCKHNICLVNLTYRLTAVRCVKAEVSTNLPQ
jgi:hypothetical protein